MPESKPGEDITASIPEKLNETIEEKDTTLEKKPDEVPFTKLEEKIEVKEEHKLYSICDVELFKPGIHNGAEYTANDINQLVENFKAMQTENKDYMIPIKIGHKSKLGDGMPAAGWITNVRNMSNNLVGDFINLPETVYKFIQLKGFKNRSIEMIENFKHSTGKNIGKLLKAVALLGLSMPAVNLKEAGKFLYGPAFSQEIEDTDCVTIEFSDEEKPKEIEPIKEAVKLPEELKNFSEDELKDLNELVLQFKATGIEKVLETLKEQKEVSEKYQTKLKEFEDKQKEIKINELKEFTNKLITDNKIVPAEREVIETLLFNMDGNKTVEFAYSEFDAKKNDSLINILKMFLNNLPSRELFGKQTKQDYFPVNAPYEVQLKTFAQSKGLTVKDLEDKEVYKKISCELAESLDKADKARGGN